MVKSRDADSLAMRVYEELRVAILHGTLAPGLRLKPADLARDRGVSLGVVREALGLLGTKSLVRIDRNRGYHVATLSGDTLKALTEARVVNEGAALRLSLTRGGVTWESEVLAAHHRLASQPMMLPPATPGEAPERNEEWAYAHLAFHHALISACGNPVLLDICDRLSDQAELYRAWSAGPGQETGRDVAAEHQGLCDAALAHDAALAVRLFEEHVCRTQQLLLGAGIVEAEQPG